MSPIYPLALIAALASGVAHAGDELGRLFLTPQQRHALDTGRTVDQDTGASSGAPGAAMPATRNIVLNGVVRRSRGPNVVWVNGARASATGSSPVRLRSGPDRRNRVTIENTEGTAVRLKPGQFWDSASGRVGDCNNCSAQPPSPDPAAAPDQDAPVAESPATGP
jgi:hypothetical protein